MPKTRLASLVSTQFKFYLRRTSVDRSPERCLQKLYHIQSQDLSFGSFIGLKIDHSRGNSLRYQDAKCVMVFVVTMTAIILRIEDISYPTSRVQAYMIQKVKYRQVHSFLDSLPELYNDIEPQGITGTLKSSSTYTESSKWTLI